MAKETAANAVAEALGTICVAQANRDLQKGPGSFSLCDTNRSQALATAFAAVSLAIRLGRTGGHPATQLKPITASTIAPPVALNKPNFIFFQSI